MIKKILGVLALSFVLGSQYGLAQRHLTIDQLFDCLEHGNSSLKSLSTSVETAEQGIQVAKTNRLPDVNASLSLSYLGNALMTDRDFTNSRWLSSPHFGNSFSLEAQQVIYAGGAIDAGITMAELQKKMAENGVTMTRSGLRFAVLGQYLDLYKLDNGIKVYEKNIDLTNQLIDNMKAKQSQGMALKNDVTRYELQLQTLSLGKKKLEDNREILNHQLCITLGIPDEKIIPDETIASATYSKNGEKYWLDRSVQNAPEMTRADLKVQIANQQVALAKSELMPKIAVVAADNFNGPFVYDVPPVNKNIMNWYIGVGVKYSLSSLWKGKKKVEQAVTNQRLVTEQNVTTVENIDTRVKQAYVMYEQSFVEHHTQEKSVELATQNYQVVNDRYLNQLALITDMLDASNVKLNAELQELDARINIAYAYYKLKYIAGEI